MSTVVPCELTLHWYRGATRCRLSDPANYDAPSRDNFESREHWGKLPCRSCQAGANPAAGHSTAVARGLSLGLLWMESRRQALHAQP